VLPSQRSSSSYNSSPASPAYLEIAICGRGPKLSTVPLWNEPGRFQPLSATDGATLLPLPSHCLEHSINTAYTKAAEAGPVFARPMNGIDGRGLEGIHGIGWSTSVSVGQLPVGDPAPTRPHRDASGEVGPVSGDQTVLAFVGPGEGPRLMSAFGHKNSRSGGPWESAQLLLEEGWAPSWCPAHTARPVLPSASVSCVRERGGSGAQAVLPATVAVLLCKT